ncbi:MAG TPA: hypothetical protein VI756_15390 [Blastocatellia bacterium]
MASQGPNFPTTGADNGNYISGEPWSDPGNITAQDGSLASSTLPHGTVSIPTQSDDILATGFGFTIPSTATIDGILVEVKEEGGGNVQTSPSGVYTTDDGGVSDFFAEDPEDTWPATLAWVSYGGPTDLWGTTWTPAQINSANFGAGISAENPATSGLAQIASIDAIRITVYYTVPTGPAGPDTDSATGSETGQIAQTGSDAATASESSSIADASSGTDSATGSESGSVTTSVSGVDSATASETSGVAVSDVDSGTGSESAGVAVSDVDSATGSESAGVAVSDVDSATVSESAGVAVSDVDSGTASETATVAVSDVDSATLSESSDVTDTGGDQTVGDSATASESATVTAAVSDVDSATLSEGTPDIEVPVSDVDSATASESATVTASVSDVDAATLSESGAVAGQVQDTDAATGSEMAGATGQVSGVDSATGSESGSVTTSVSGIDAAAAQDSTDMAEGSSQAVADSATASEASTLTVSVTDSATATESGTPVQTTAAPQMLPVVVPFLAILEGMAAEFGDGWQSDLATRRARFNEICMSAIEPSYFYSAIPGAVNYVDFFSRLFELVSDELGSVDQVLTYLDSLFRPGAAPEVFVDWMLAEFFGWTLIPDGYPLIRKRQLLANLPGHYKRRGTREGIVRLLAEFGVHATATDTWVYWGGSYYGEYAVDGPLQVRVVIKYSDPWDTPGPTFIGDYYGYCYPYPPKLIVTQDFCMQLMAWERSAGMNFSVEWETWHPTPPDQPPAMYA